ncbi:hypothetical protein Indivirus_1_47 [Indivirus ILV1]|uniref:Uncharacterized protein n=1 Tax=Indivirus ILV1 TaxID=1977633 RepID=A0A1V0SCR6_9VIRU|nr:hypothetical protein Indivirus_1_47 [Indivirus ILV1]
MYIDQIDDLIDKIIDDFYSKSVDKKDIMKYFEEPNFVKYQLEINKMWEKYIETIDKKSINAILKDESNTEKMIDYIKRYIAYYVLMMFAYFYTAKSDTYINNVIEFSKNQPSFNFKIANFFNAESNGTTIQYYSLIKHMADLINSDAVKFKQLMKHPSYNDAVTFLSNNNLDEEIIKSSFSFKSLGGNKHVQAHNIVKTILLMDLYFKHDKKIVHEFLDKKEVDSGEFIYIDIVVPETDYIDYNTIELSLSQKDIERGFASEIYDLLTQYDQSLFHKSVSHDEKINELLNRKLIIPIVEDFLLYHKDTERYEKNIPTQNQDTNTKKKDETRIKYIINKIDSAIELFSKNTKDNKKLEQNTEKIFYGPLSDRRAVLINNYEDIKIITKLQNQGRKAIENNEFYNDLLSYVQYPYVNFKDFKGYGFGIIPERTIDAIRSIDFELNSNKIIQSRVGHSERPINIIGFVIPSIAKDIKCFKKNELIDVRRIGVTKDKKISKISNGYTMSLKMIQRNITSYGKKYPYVYWLFDLDKDKVSQDIYDVAVKLNNSEYFKIVVSKLHDNIMSLVGNHLIEYFEKHKDTSTIQYFYKLIRKINSNIIVIPDNSKIYNELERLAYYEKIIKTKDKYDHKDDEFPGLIGDVIKLPIYNKPQPGKMQIIKLEKTIVKGTLPENEEIIESGAICQHHITWDNISALRTKNPNKFSELLFSFFQQYVDINYEGDYVCKSCGILINLKNYVTDGTYDDDGRFVSLNMTMQVNVEDIPGYEKYKSSIRNIEKLIDRVASISNIKTLTGTSTTIKNRIGKVVKDTIDLLLVHNSRLKDIYKERSQKISAYGINKDLTNLFVFELDNSIFVYSSKDKDTYKPIKRNNILLYLTFLIMLEISDSQLYFMTGDKACNYYFFTKYGITWFEGLYIRKNNQNTVTKITNYGVLCYIIFYISCMLTKYNLWQRELSPEGEVQQKKKFDPTVQKIIIHTLVDLINSIIEIYSTKKKNYIYDIVANRFFNKLSSTFQNEEILNRIKTIEERKIVTDGKKIKHLEVKVKAIPVPNEYEKNTYNESLSLLESKCKNPKYFITKRNLDEIIKYYNISSITNCDEGSFHKWSYTDNTLICSVCNVKITDIINVRYQEMDKISNNYKLIIAKKFCKTQKSGEACNKMNQKEIENIYDKYQKQKQEKEVKLQEKVDKDEEVTMSKSQKQKEFINKIKSEYGQAKRHKEDYYKFIDLFIDELEKNLGKDKQNLRYDTYIINHDHNGYPVTPFSIVNVNDKIIIKKNHPFFKTDVIYYRNFKLQIDVFYDAINKLLLGYKEKNKEYKYAKRTNVYMEVNYSVKSMIRQLCYPSNLINISERMENYKFIYKTPEERINNVISDISRERIQGLKKAITDFQKYIYQVSYKYEKQKVMDDEDPDIFLNNYKDKLTKLVLRQDKTYKFLKNWKAIKYELFFEDISNKTINISQEQKYVSLDEISEYDYSGNVILFYIINEMKKLIENNRDKFIKTTLCNLLIDIIMRIYFEYDKEKDMTNGQIKRFMYITQLKDYSQIDDTEFETEGIYGEYKDPDATPDEELLEEKEDAKEEEDALDIEDELDYEVDYTPEFFS